MKMNHSFINKIIVASFIGNNMDDNDRDINNN